MIIPPGFKNQDANTMCKLKKPLYSLKQSPRAWLDRCTKVLRKQGYQQKQSDHTMFFWKTKNKNKNNLIMYVDDIIITGDNLEEIERLKTNLTIEFEVKDMGQIWYFLGIEVARSKREINVSQCKCILDLLIERDMPGCKPNVTPIKVGKKYEDFLKPIDNERYRRIVGNLIYLSHARPDIVV